MLINTLILTFISCSFRKSFDDLYFFTGIVDVALNLFIAILLCNYLGFK